MSLFEKIFGSGVAKKSSGELFKSATQFKKSGDWDKAIKSLRQAYKQARSEGVSYGHDAYLRLPKYLFEAGKPDEAWSEYNRALANGLDGTTPSKEMMAVEQGQIYAAMSGQLKKEKKFYDAAVYQAASALSWQKGMLAQKRDLATDFDSLKKTLTQLLKKQNASESSEQFLSSVEKAVSNPKTHQVPALIRQLQDLKK